MTADVNVTEKVARALWEAETEYDYAWEPNADTYLDAARNLLAVLSDPEVLAGIAGVLRDTYAHTACGGDPTTAGEVSDWLPEATAVVEWLRRQG